jgi:hypothetical protein
MGTNSKGERIRQPQQRQQKKEGVKVFHPKRIRKRKELISLFIISYDCEVTHIEDYNSPTKADSHESFFPRLDISLNLFTALMALGCETQLLILPKHLSLGWVQSWVQFKVIMAIDIGA